MIGELKQSSWRLRPGRGEGPSSGPQTCDPSLDVCRCCIDRQAGRHSLDSVAPAKVFVIFSPISCGNVAGGGIGFDMYIMSVSDRTRQTDGRSIGRVFV